MKVLFVGRDYTALDDGGKIVTKRNCDFLKQICTQVDEILRPRGTIKTFIKNIILNEGYGYTKSIQNKFQDLIKSNQYDFVWLDGSCDSTIAKECVKLKIPVICFYHNVESIFYNSKAINSKSLKDKIFAKYIQNIEKETTINAKYHIMLNERDAYEVSKLFDVRCDLILPTSFPAIEISKLNTDHTHDSYLLFVGSNFWANIEGLKFFFNEVAPYVNKHIKIVGSICEAFRNQILPKNVTLEGRVENLDPYYADAVAVISPILSGSGTKTKTIEALRFGKTIIGSPEALMGVPEEYYVGIGTICRNSQDYINAINDLPDQKFNRYSFDVFIRCFSDEAVFEKLKRFISSKFQK